MVERQQEAAGPEPDPPGLGEGARKQQVRRGIGLPGDGVVFADPGLAVAELVQPADHLKIPIESGLQVPLRRVGGHGEKAEIH